MEMKVDQPVIEGKIEGAADSKKMMGNFVEDAFIGPLREAIKEAVINPESSDEPLGDLQARLERYIELKKDLTWIVGIEPGKFNKDYRPDVAEALSLLVSESTMPGDESGESEAKELEARALFMEACGTVYHRHGSGTAESILNATEDWRYFVSADDVQSALYGVVRDASPESIDRALEQCAELIEGFANDNRVFTQEEEVERGFVEQVVKTAYKLELLKDKLAREQVLERAKQAAGTARQQEVVQGRADAQEALDVLERIENM